LQPVPATVGAKLMELWRVMCISSYLDYKSPLKSRYVAVSREPRVMTQVVAPGILLYQFLMVVLNYAEAIVW
jgi:hypothetical protein